MKHVFKIGDTVKLTRSNNPYVPVGSLLKVESITTLPLILNVSYDKQKYFVHVNDVKPTASCDKEKVDFI